MRQEIKSYVLHDLEYKRMLKEGIPSWNERSSEEKSDIYPRTRQFLESIIEQKCIPTKGSILELGCGTGPFAKYFAANGYQGIGVDISPTAIELAKASRGNDNIEFIVDDVCKLQSIPEKSVDIVIDGLCLHCVTNQNDRRSLIASVYERLKPGGVFVVMTMCRPLVLAEFENQYLQTAKLIEDVIYVPIKYDQPIHDARVIDGLSFIPTRIFLSQDRIIKSLHLTGFEVTYSELVTATPEAPNSMLYLVAKKNPQHKVEG